MHYNCLIVDDEADLAKMTCEYFQMFDVTCAYVEDAAACMRFLEENVVDLLLLDINLSAESGFLLCKKIRQESDVPILFISARQSDEDVLAALHIGGDDYIKKPYSLNVLLAKVRVVLKRMSAGPDSPKAQPDSCTVDAADGLPQAEESQTMYLDEATFRVHIRGKEIPLKAREFYLLQCLYENRNIIVTKEKLFDIVWKDKFYSDGTLNVHIRRLREKIEENPNEPKLIKTVWGTGYMLESR